MMTTSDLPVLGRRAGTGDRRIAMLGAGPTGFGAARRPQESGYRGRGSYEADAHVGGLAVGGNDRSGRR